MVGIRSEGFAESGERIDYLTLKRKAGLQQASGPLGEHMCMSFTPVIILIRYMCIEDNHKIKS